MIRSIRHRGLRRLYENNDPRGVMAEHAEKLRDILARLDAARVVTDMDLPGFRLHPLRGNLRGYWAVTVRANWRVIFRFADGEASEVDYVNLSHYQSMDPDVDRSKRKKCLKACGNALPTDHQAAILLLEPGKGALRGRVPAGCG